MVTQVVKNAFVSRDIKFSFQNFMHSLPDDVFFHPFAWKMSHLDEPNLTKIIHYQNWKKTLSSYIIQFLEPILRL
jgi:hypothetical protein